MADKELLGVPHLAGTQVLYEVGRYPTIGEYASAVYVYGPCSGDLMSLGSGGILPWRDAGEGKEEGGGQGAFQVEVFASEQRVGRDPCGRPYRGAQRFTDMPSTRGRAQRARGPPLRASSKKTST